MSIRAKLLLHDNDPAVRQDIARRLRLAGHIVVIPPDEASVLASERTTSPDLILLGFNAGRPESLRLLRDLRRSSRIPVVVVLPDRNDTSAVVAALEHGADDCIDLRSEGQELHARIQALLRRARWSSTSEAPRNLRVGSLWLDTDKRSATVNGKALHLTPTEYELLFALVQGAGRVVMHADLLRWVWGADYRTDLAVLRVNISRLRQKIESAQRGAPNIETIPGVGYTLSFAWVEQPSN